MLNKGFESDCQYEVAGVLTEKKIEAIRFSSDRPSSLFD
jgi:hypothetical protein